MTHPLAKPKKAPSVPHTFDGEIYQAVGKYARSAVLFAFEDMGGPASLSEWARENKDDFYTKLFPKIIARESEVTHHKTVDQLMDVIDGDFEVDGDFDDAEIIPTPPVYASEPVTPDYAPVPIESEWNATQADFDDDEILSIAADYVDFEE